VRFFLLFTLLATLLFSSQTAEVSTTQSNSAVEKSLDPNSEEESFEDEFNDNSDFDDEFGDEFSADIAEEVFDPLSGYNRVITTFNDTLYVYLLNPLLIKGYNFVLPEEARISVNNFFENLYFPVSFVNNIFQLKFKQTGTEAARFGINSTIGILGLFDPARSWFELEAHKEDFGQTLGYYGVESGFHIVLPFFGPTNLRDLSGDFLDFYVNPIYYVDVRKYNLVNSTYQGWMAITYKEFNKMSLYTKEYDNVREDALDLYPFLRDLYEQNRQKEIKE